MLERSFSFWLHIINFLKNNSKTIKIRKRNFAFSRKNSMYFLILVNFVENKEVILGM